MKRSPLQRKWIAFTIVAFIFFSPSFLQGCSDGLLTDQEEDTLVFDARDRSAPPVSQRNDKLRFPEMLDLATRPSRFAGKTGSSESTDLFVAFNEYEADGLTPRMLDKYAVTSRILQEYGITRRILDKYGVTPRILSQFGITRRILNQYDVTRRLLSQYGITPRILSQYGDLITEELLKDFQVTEAVLREAGLSEQDIADFNKLAAVLKEHQLTAEMFASLIETAISSIRLKVHIDNAHLGITIHIDAEVLDAFLEEVGDDPDILFVEPDFAFDTSELGNTSGAWYDHQIIPWGITSVETPLPSAFEWFGAGYVSVNPVHVFILDSGVMADSWLDDLYVVERKDFTMLFENREMELWDESQAPDVSGFDPGNSGNPYDESGHGTHIAGTIGAKNDLTGVAGVAPGVKIHSLKVLTKDGRTDITTIMAAVDYVTRTKQENPHWPIVVNLSLGVDIGTTAYNVLDEAIQASIDAGVIYVASAGNSGMNAATYSPAHVQDVITVGAYDANNTFAGFSNYGPTVDILAPGESIISLSHIIEETNKFESILASGTSFAAPHVTGAVARYIGDNPTASATQVANALIDAATPTISGVPGSTTNKALNVKNLLAETADLVKSDDAEVQWSWGSWFTRETAVETRSGLVKDQFTALSFNGNNGTDNWAGDWQEIGESNGVENGRIQIRESNRCAEGNCLRVNSSTDGRGVSRSVDLSNTEDATLTFSYRRNSTVANNVHFEASNDGGSSWKRLYTFASGNDNTQQLKSIDLSSFKHSETQIRFIVYGDGNGGLFIDNIAVTY